MLHGTLFKVGGFEFRYEHLLVIGILALSFSISFLLRAQPAQYGFELHEFDPYFNFRATEYIVENGFGAYLDWNDEMSWYPEGRDVSGSSQLMLHLTTALAYSAFGGGSLYDFTILFPVVFGSLTAIVVFALVRVIGGTTAGLLASLFFSVSLSVMIRGQIGWFKSEPLGLFYGLLAAYLLLSGLAAKNYKISAAKLVGAGILTTFGFSAWGGNQFFVLPICIFFVALPFIRQDHRFLLWAIPAYTAAAMLSALAFERTSANFATELQGLVLVASAAFAVICIAIQHKSARHKRRNAAIFLLAILVAAPTILAVGVASEGSFLPSYRYLNAINPLLTSTDSLTGSLSSSISEHATPSISQSFFFHSVLMVFGALGAWLIFGIKKSNPLGMRADMAAFALILGITGAYASSAFLRLELFASVSLIVLASVGLGMLLREFFSRERAATPRPMPVRAAFLAGIVLLLLVPMVYPQGSEIHAVLDTPPVIMNGGTSYVTTATTDWIDTLDWIKNNTPPDSIVAAWWDYGYWITTMSERTTLADNATLDSARIRDLAAVLMGPPDRSWSMLNDLEADYMLVFVAANQLGTTNDEQFYSLGIGADESKKGWFIRIGGFDGARLLHPDRISATDEFWDNTMLGRMIPYQLLAYVNPEDPAEQSRAFLPGHVGVYTKAVKFPEGGDGPLRLAYASPSFYDDGFGPKLTVLVYEVNKDYAPGTLGPVPPVP